MRHFTTMSAMLAVLVAILAPPVIAWLQAAPLGGDLGPPRADPYPNLPPLSELARLPSAEIAKDWGRLQKVVRAEAIAKWHDRTLPAQLSNRYKEIASETRKRMEWVRRICIAHDPTADECTRRNCILGLQGYEAYYTGRWPPPVPVELMPENKP
jgi:hypothetical protein